MNEWAACWLGSQRSVVQTASAGDRLELRADAESVYEARAFRCGFGLRCGCCGAGAERRAGACAAARVGALPRQKLTIAAAMKTLE